MDFRFLPIDFPSEATNPSPATAATLSQECAVIGSQAELTVFLQHGSCSPRADILESNAACLLSPV